MVGAAGQGPYMAIVLKVEGERIAQARFSTYACPVAVSCGQFVCDRIEGGPVEAARSLDEGAIIMGVGQMPLGRDHCPGLAAGALRDALKKFDGAMDADSLTGG